MLIVVMMVRSSDDIACELVHQVRFYSVLDTVVISGDDVCYSVLFDTLVGVSVFSVIRCELADDICYWSSVYECQRAECVFHLR